MTPTLQRLRTVAEAATPGAWVTRGGNLSSGFNVLGENGRALRRPVCVGTLPKDAAHIATFDPPTVLRLLAAVEWVQVHAQHLTTCGMRGPIGEAKVCSCGLAEVRAGIEGIG